MGKSVNVKGVDIDILTSKQLEEAVTEYLSNDHLNIIFLVSADMIARAEQDEDYREILARADLCLPEEKNILGEHRNLSEHQEAVTDYRWIEASMSGVKKSEKTLYLVGDREERIKRFMDFCEEQYPDMGILGAFCINPELGPEPIINEINAADPDIIIAIIESPMQERWIAENVIKINARLCIGIGNIVERITEKKSGIPKIIREVRQFFKKE